MLHALRSEGSLESSPMSWMTCHDPVVVGVRFAPKSGFRKKVYKINLTSFVLTHVDSQSLTTLKSYTMLL